jgi:hypothetical protein
LQAGPPALDSRLSVDDKIDFVTKIAVRENGFPSFKMLAVDRFIVKKPVLCDVARQEDVEDPVGNQPKLTVKSRELRDINRATTATRRVP